MKCPNHPNDDLEIKDFYFNKKTGLKVYKECKKCILKKAADKKKEEMKYYFA